RQYLQHRVELLRRAHQVHVQAVHRQRGRQRQVVVECAEIRGQQDLRTRLRRLAQDRVGAFIRRARGLIEVLYEQRLIQLHPVGAGFRQLRQQLHVRGQQGIQQGERRRVVGGLGQQQE